MCILCQPWKQGQHGTATLDDLCDRHRADVEESLADNQCIHPEGRCTGECGCMSLEEFMARHGRTEAPA